MTSLRNLVFSGCGTFPEGPYLSRLQRLSLLDWEYEEGIPPALQGAAQLQTLDDTPPTGFSSDDDDYVDDDDADAAVVMMLPAALKTFTLVYACAPGPDEWNRKVAHFRAASIAKGRVPPVIKGYHIIVP